MRVLCIEDKWTYMDGITPLPPPYPIYMQIYVVADEHIDKDCEFYVLQEFIDAFGDDDGWEKCAFVPISDIDERETEVYKNLKKSQKWKNLIRS